MNKLSRILHEVALLTDVGTQEKAEREIKDLFVELLKSDSEVFNGVDIEGQMAITSWGNELIAKINDL